MLMLSCRRNALQTEFYKLASGILCFYPVNSEECLPRKIILGQNINYLPFGIWWSKILTKNRPQSRPLRVNTVYYFQFFFLDYFFLPFLLLFSLTYPYLFLVQIQFLRAGNLFSGFNSVCKILKAKFRQNDRFFTIIFYFEPSTFYIEFVEN